MSTLNSLDYTIIALYIVGLVALGLWFRRIASRNMNSYFLAEKSLPWWMLGISGMGYSLDLAGTMLIISLLYIFGPRGLFIEFRGGLSLAMICQMIWTGKWHRRSGCMTVAEWMTFRFGEDRGANFARAATAVVFIVLTAAMLTYLAVGTGMFLSQFVPFTPFQCSLVLIGAAAVSTVMSGLYGVVFADLFQCALIVVGIAIVTVLALMRMDDTTTFVAIAQSVTGTSQWADSFPGWTATVPPDYEQYKHLFLYTMVFLVINKLIIGGFGTGHEPQFFAARDERECGLLACLWSVLMLARWPFMIAFAILGIYLVQSFFPNMDEVAQAVAVIKEHVVTDQAGWREALSQIKLHPDQYADLVASLQGVLGDQWADRLELLGYEGTVNAERLVPAIIIHAIPAGVRGLLLVALMAASLSTFNVTVNKASAMWTNDLYQRFMRPRATTRELLASTYIFCALLIGLSFTVAYKVSNINAIWGWITMGLASGMGMPMLLRFYWWRFNGAGFAAGMFGGMFAALAVIVYNTAYPDNELSEVTQFLLLTPISAILAIAGTYLGSPTPQPVLERFYRMTRPFGFWGDYQRRLPADVRVACRREHRNDLIALPIAFVWMITMYLAPMQFMIGRYGAGWISTGLFVLSCAGLYVFWYRNLPSPSPRTETVPNAAGPTVEDVQKVVS
ncbi:MAG: sodium:solute symporter [Phycisphaerae bacterium]|nr:sodium:solute symporter [Phycisphaerae bacterium]